MKEGEAIISKKILGRSEKMKFEIRQIDAWFDGETWTCNESFRIGDFSTKAKNVKRAFCRALHGLGVVFYRGRVVVVDDGELLEIQDRKSGEPLFVAIPID